MDGAVFEVALNSSPGVATCALLREPNANHELISCAAGPVAVTEMIATLLMAGPGSVLGPADVWRLSLADRDRIVAVLHTMFFGDHIESIVSCNACRQPFEITFSLAEEVLGPLQRSVSTLTADEHGFYCLTDGRRFRVPNTEDERALIGLPLEQACEVLTRRCVAAGEVGMVDDTLISAWEGIAPILDTDVPVTCPHCHSQEKAHFEMVSFFLACMQRQRPIVLREIHSLAAAYHWRQEDIMRLPRSLRQSFVALIEADRGTLRAVS